LRELPLVCESDSEEGKRQRQLLDQLGQKSAVLEQILAAIAMRREPASVAFSRSLAINGSEPLLPAKTMLLTFLETGQGVSVISVTERVINLEATVHQKDLVKAVSELLRGLGNAHERNDVDLANLKNDSWQASAAALHKLLFPTREPAYWSQFNEIIVVPDGVLWYTPFQLVLSEPEPKQPLRIRVCPMVAMSIPNTLPPSKFPKTLLIGRRSTLKELQTRFDEQLQMIKTALPAVETATDAGKLPTSLLGSVIDRLIAWTDEWKSSPTEGGSFSWLPEASGKPGHTLFEWQMLPWSGPRQLIVPQFSTSAGNGLRSGNLNGNELFHLSCQAISGGAQTLLISRWNVGDRSPFQASAEFARAANDHSAIDAWQLTVEAIKQLPVDVSEASRIKAPGGDPADRKCDHPFFWAGYLLIDTGWQPAVAVE
jgi:hypothetical protein